MIQTYLLTTDSLPDPEKHPTAWEACLRRLPAERIGNIRRMRHTEQKEQSLGAGLLIQDMLKRLALQAEITYEAYGKPVCQQIPFNLSHTREAVILSVWEGSRERGDAGIFIGCDIEQIKPYQKGIAKRFFTEAESAGLEAIGDPAVQAERFCRYWTKKESVMKLTGLGLSLPMQLYDVQDRQAAVDRSKTRIWYEKGCQKEFETERKKAEFVQAANLLLEKKLCFKEYRYQGCCISVCATVDRFASDYILAKSGAEGI